MKLINIDSDDPVIQRFQDIEEPFILRQSAFVDNELMMRVVAIKDGDIVRTFTYSILKEGDPT